MLEFWAVREKTIRLQPSPIAKKFVLYRTLKVWYLQGWKGTPSYWPLSPFGRNHMGHALHEKNSFNLSTGNQSVIWFFNAWPSKNTRVLKIFQCHTFIRQSQYPFNLASLVIKDISKGHQFPDHKPSTTILNDNNAISFCWARLRYQLQLLKNFWCKMFTDETNG